MVLFVLAYPVKISKRAAAVRVECPDFPEIRIDLTNGDDALAVARDILERTIAARMTNGADIPEPSVGRQQALLSTQTAIKVRLYQAARKKGISNREFARRLNWNSAQVDRLFSLEQQTRLDHLDAACHALGLQLTVELEAADPT